MHVFARQSSILAHVLLAGALVAPVSVWATEAANLKLPTSPYGCQACHGSDQATPTTVPGTAIVPFTALGLDWLAQSPQEENRLWSDLAIGNVDGDGCAADCTMEQDVPATSYRGVAVAALLLLVASTAFLLRRRSAA